jgi:acetate---CoA ligase (ADP-forming) subunit beta
MRPKAAEVIERVRSEGRNIVLEPEAKQILQAYGVPVTNEAVCGSPDEAVMVAQRIGYPVAMKVVSPQVVHKTEFKAVCLNVPNDKDVVEIYRSFEQEAMRANFDLSGVLVSEMVTGQEMIIGSTKDPQFGNLIMLGMGGIAVQVYKDVSYRLAPVTELDVKEMLSEIKGAKLLYGFRGRERANIQALTEALIAVSNMLMEVDDIAEMDLNPIFVSSQGVRVADARILLS